MLHEIAVTVFTAAPMTHKHTNGYFKKGIQPAVKQMTHGPSGTTGRKKSWATCCCQSVVGNMRSCFTLPFPCLDILLMQRALQRKEKWAIFRLPHSFSTPQTNRP